ncbi:hypothetical protein Tco_0168247 [Tanacetum coccineum]
MAWLPRIVELRQVANSSKWEDMFILYCHRSMIEDYMLAREINRVCGEVNSAVEERSHFLQELDKLVGRHVVEKMAEFLKEIQRKDKERVLQLQILRKEKDLFIEKLKGVQVVVACYPAVGCLQKSIPKTSVLPAVATTFLCRLHAT